MSPERTMHARPAVRISSRSMRIDELIEIADGRRLALDPDAVAMIQDSRAVVEEVLASGRPVYGLNMGLGHMRDTRLPDSEIRALQKPMVEGHVGAIGAPLPRRVVRAAMAARINGMARGGAGATLGCAETYVAMLNAGVHPIVEGSGSVGASDLSQMAAIAQVALGGGVAELGGETLPGGEALRRAGIPTLRLEAKDGLALMSANGIAVGHGALVVWRARQLLEVADLAAVLALEAISGNTSPFDSIVAAAKGVRGQAEVSDHMRRHIRGSHILEYDAARTVQDALSFRVVPQVHGALWEFIELARRAVEAELNAMTDNPLVSVRERRMISNGNFHPMMVALAFDALRPALAHAGQLSDRRLNHLWAATFQTPAGRPIDASRSVWGSIGDLRGTSLRYAAAAASAELRQQADPATLDIAPLDLGIEDHATGAPLSVRRTETALDRLEDVLAVEFLMARDVLVSGGEAQLGVGATAVLQTINAVLRELPQPSDSGQFHAAVVRAMRNRLLDDARQVVGRLEWPA